MGLKEYQAKRDFTRTAEPPAKPGAARTSTLFVVQKHAASHLHYDFRLEMEGVLKSWAVPKGFPTRRGDRRLAVQVEDHPFDYKDFEGTIPEGNYGAGTVMVWDTGTYEVAGDDALGALQAGKLHLTLHGKKLEGDWTLVRMRPRSETAKPQWLLLKSGSDLPAFSVRAEDRSVLTGRSLEQIAGARHKREWQSNRTSARSKRLESQQPRSRSLPRTSRSSLPRATARPAQARSRHKKAVSSKASSTREIVSSVELPELPAARPAFIPPMKALLVEHLPAGALWVYEIKFDGVRALAVKDDAQLKLWSRNQNELSSRYPSLVQALDQIPAKQFVLDGEVVAVDEQGRSSFQLLQSYQSAPAGRKPPLLYYVFDLLNLNGRDLRSLPLWQRKQAAEQLVANISPLVRFSASLDAPSDKVRRAMQSQGLEGLIAKQKDSAYQPGKRSGAWVKFKWSNEQEFVIGGYSSPKGARSHFGALLVGYYDHNRLLFAAKVGTGFDEKQLASLYRKFQPLVRSACPFANLPEKPTGTARGLTAREMRFCTWLAPQLVCQVRFAEWTRDGHLRQPAFLGLREDKSPKEVVRELPK